MSAPVLRWQWAHFDALDGAALYAALELRQQVFVLEQRCLFPDIDRHDQRAHHLLGWRDDGDGAPLLAAYLRCLPPGEKFAECSIGRVVTAPAVRGSGVGRLLVAQGVQRTVALYPAQPIRIGAQMHLERFYAGFGFETVSAPYDEDDILHVEMLRAADVAA